MRSTTSKSLLGCLLFSTSLSAQASTYAISTTWITDFTVSNATVSGWTNSQDFTINGGSVLADGDTTDPSVACSNCTSDENSFVAHGAVGPNYAYADALINSTDMVAGGEARAITEIYAENGVDASASASNSITAFMTTDTLATSVNFDFDIASYLAVDVTGADAGFANMSFQLTVKQGNTVVGSYVPSAYNFGIGPSDDSATINVSNAGFALNGLTGNTTYSLNISMSQDVFSAVQPVPVPAAVWLFGSGLIGLVAVARRRKEA